MKGRGAQFWLGLAVFGLGLSLLWHLSTFLPINHEALQFLEVPLFLGAFVTFSVGWVGLARLLGRLGWDTGLFLGHVRRHYIAGVPIAACILLLICSSFVSPSDVVPSAPGNLERDAGMPVLHSPEGITPISEGEFQSLVAQHEREFNTGFIFVCSFAIAALYIVREEKRGVDSTVDTDPSSGT